MNKRGTEEAGLDMITKLFFVLLVVIIVIVVIAGWMGYFEKVPTYIKGIFKIFGP